MDWLIIAPLAGLASIGASFYLFFYMNKQDSGTPKMREISTAIKEGAIAYLKRQNMTLTVFVLIMAAIVGIFLGYEMALAYVFGSFCTALASFFGMSAAIRANVRTSNAARNGLKQAFPIAFYGGAVMGLSIVGIALLGISILYYIYGDPGVILGFSFGASTLALFAKAGGGIFTKTADIGADLVGKVEIGIPEDDPRNPAVIADNVGDNVGDVAGMGADLFESYVGSMVAAIAIGSALPNPMAMMLLPIVIVMAGLLSSAAGVLSMGFLQRMDPQAALRNATLIAAGILIVLSWVVVRVMDVGLAPFWAVLSGLLAGSTIGYLTELYTSGKRVEEIAESCKTGSATNIITGIAIGFELS